MIHRSLLLGVMLVACGSTVPDQGPQPVAYQGMLPATVPARLHANVLTIAATVNGTRARALLVDTGAALTGVDPIAYADANLAAGGQVLSSLNIGSLAFKDVPSTSLNECGNACGAFDVTGVLGGNVLRSFTIALDYRAPAVTFGQSPTPAGVLPTPQVIAFRLAGGGTGIIAGGSGTVLDVPRSRIVVSVEIEGALRTLVVDTGASYTLLRQSLYTALVADGRAQLRVQSATASGIAQGSLTRARSLALDRLTSTGAVMTGVPDELVQNLENEVGTAIDGLLGGSFLRTYYAVVDYAGSRLLLYPYSTPDTRVDELVRTPVFLTAKGSTYVVDQVLTGVSASDAQKVQGRTLIDIDGTKLDGLDPEAADRLLRGPTGAAHTLHVQRAGSLEVDAVVLPVLDVLPSP